MTQKLFILYLQKKIVQYFLKFSMNVMKPFAHFE